MIRGEVVVNRAGDGTAALEPQVSIPVSGTDRTFRTVEVVVDTGFTGHLTLPERTITQLGLRFLGERRAELADGKHVTYSIYGAMARWHDQDRTMLVHRSESRPLLGMALLNGSRLTVEAWEGGDVAIEETPRGIR